MSLTHRRLTLALLTAVSSPARASDPPTPNSDTKTRTLAEKELVEEEETVRLSLPTEADRAAWQQAGLRIALGYSYGRMSGNLQGIDTAFHNLTLRPSVRLDEHWSLGASLTYAIARWDLSGLRWSISLEPTWHPWSGLGVTLGAGYAGLLVDRLWPEETDYPAREPSQELPDTPVGGYDTPPKASRSRNVVGDERLSHCSGSGWNLLARIEVLFVAGPRFASGPFVQADHQWVQCEQQSSSSSTDAETGKPVMVREWWRHQGASLGWWLSWR